MSACLKELEETEAAERMTDEELRAHFKHKHYAPVERERNEADDYCQPERYFR